MCSADTRAPYYVNVTLHLPWMTPSGFSIGMILKTNLFLRTCALGWLLVRWRRSPLITQLELDSPGCTLQEITTYFLLSFAASVSSTIMKMSSALKYTCPQLVAQNFKCHSPIYTTPLFWIWIHLAKSGSGIWQV